MSDSTSADIEAVKTVAELYSPVTGTITEVNGALSADAGVINADPYGTGWIIKVKLDKVGLSQLVQARRGQGAEHSSRSPGRLRRPSMSLARSRASRRQMIRMLTRQVILALGSIAPWTPPPRRAKRPGRGESGGVGTTARSGTTRK